MRFSLSIMWFAAIFFLAYGLAFAIHPAGMAYLTTQLELNSVSALVDLRATYGGMTMAVGIFILYLWRSASIQHSLVGVSAVLLFMAITRAIGFLADGQTNVLMYVYFGAEVAGAALAMYAIRLANNANH